MGGGLPPFLLHQHSPACFTALQRLLLRCERYECEAAATALGEAGLG